MRRDFFHQYSTRIGGPGLTAAAYALPKDDEPSYVRFGAAVESIPPSPSTGELPDRGVGSSQVEPITRSSRAKESE